MWCTLVKYYCTQNYEFNLRGEKIDYRTNSEGIKIVWIKRF
jgi:hypothetical protein